MKENYITYEGPMNYKGIDDLKPEYLFYGNSQGDETRTNNLSTYLNSEGWVGCFLRPVPKTQEEVDEIIKERKIANSKYIAELKVSGEFGKEIGRSSISINPCPLFDNPNRNRSSNGPTESYSYDIITL